MLAKYFVFTRMFNYLGSKFGPISQCTQTETLKPVSFDIFVDQAEATIEKQPVVTKVNGLFHLYILKLRHVLI